MILLKQGHYGPSVVVLQVLLRAVGGATIAQDGIFGPRTRQAVIAFQRVAVLDRDGVVGVDTWSALAHRAKVTIADVVDVYDPDQWNKKVVDLRAAGGDPIIMHGMSNGVAEAVSRVISRYPAGSVVLVRFHSHGAAGDQNVSAGKGGDSRADLSGISSDNIPLIQPQLARLGQHLAPFGCIQFHGCDVAEGPGKQMLQQVANAAKRPVSAGIRNQYGGYGRFATNRCYATFSFEGPVVDAYPNCMSLREWARTCYTVRQSGPVGAFAF